jgi:hypothetical protein
MSRYGDFRLIGRRWPIEEHIGELALGFRGDLSYEALSDIAEVWGNFGIAADNGVMLVRMAFTRATFSRVMGSRFPDANLHAGEWSGTMGKVIVSGVNVVCDGVTLWARPLAAPPVMVDPPRPAPRIGWHAVDHDTKARPAKSRLCGVEIEVNGSGNFGEVLPKLGRWGVHYDGSCGWEAVSPPTPVSSIGRMWSPVIDAIAGAENDVDSRCGLHVHVSAKGLTPAMVVRVLNLWEHCQPLLFAICGQKRILSEYCTPIDMSSVVDEAGDDPVNMIDHLQQSRYWAVNVRNYREYDKVKNTIEFRAHRGTLDKRRILGWARLMVAIVDAASRMSAKEFRSIMLERSRLRALARIAPKSIEFIMWRLKEYRAATTLRGAPRMLIVKRHMSISERRSGQRSGFRIQSETQAEESTPALDALDEALAPLDATRADTGGDVSCTDSSPCETCRLAV